MKKMDTPLTGSNQQTILCIETEKVALTIKGRCNYPGRDTMPMEEKSSVKVFSARSSLDVQVLGTREHLETSLYEKTCIPLFYEERDYEICIEYDKEDAVEFMHQNVNLRSQVTQTGKKHPFLSGIINFKSEIGYSDLIVLVNEEEYLKVVIEVFPTKLDYQRDYFNLMKDISDEVYNLAFDFMRKTYQQMELIEKCDNTETEFFSILQLIYHRFLCAADTIIRRTHHELQEQREIVPERKVKRMHAGTVKWIEKHPQYVRKSSSGELHFEKVLSIRKEVSYDTYENRFVKHILNSVRNRLESLLSSYSVRKDDVLTSQIQKMRNLLYQRVNASFLRQIGEFRKTESMSLVFAMAPGYKELFRYYQMLQMGLSFQCSLFQVSMKDTATLYEYWCFIKLNRILKDNYLLKKSSLLKVKSNGLTLSLQKGKKSEMEYENPMTGEKISLTYNRGIGQLPTGSEKPDNILSLSKREDGQNYQYIFDAKYRIDMALENSEYYGESSHKSGPKKEDIAVMHRYRDAIVHQNGINGEYRRDMFGAYVLFPYDNEEEYKSHRFCQSIEKVNVGGLPFLPGATSLVEKLIKELAWESAASAFERATLPKGIERRLANTDFSVRDVLVGNIKSKEQFENCLEKRQFEIPANLVSDKKLGVMYIALQQNKETFHNQAGIHYYGEVIKVQARENDEGRELYCFQIGELHKLKRSIELSPDVCSAVYYTNRNLLEVCNTTRELLLDSAEKFRLYRELNRLSSKISIRTNEEKVEGFEFNNYFITASKEQISVFTQNYKPYSLNIKDYSRRTNKLYQEVWNIVNNEK